MLFLLILLLTTFSIAGSAAFFSVYGLAHIFSGSFWAVVFMGASLEAGKLVSASFLYRYWKTIGLALKTYLMAAVLLLMVITSTGIFGYLSAAYQTDTLEYKKVEAKLLSLTSEKEELLKRKTDIDKQISDLPADYVTAKQRLMKTFGPEIERINKRLPEVTSEIQQLNQHRIQVQAHTGPVTYIATAFGLTVDDATKWIVLMLIIVFDPLAVALTLATNKVIIEKQRMKEKDTKQLTNNNDTNLVPPTSSGEPKPVSVPEKLVRKGNDVKESFSIDDSVIPITKTTKAEEESNANISMENTLNKMMETSNNLQKMVENTNSKVDTKLEELQQALTELSNEHNPSPESKHQQEILEKLIKKKSVLSQVRQGKNNPFI